MLADQAVELADQVLDHAALIHMASVAVLDRDRTFCPASLEGLDDLLGMRDPRNSSQASFEELARPRVTASVLGP